MRVAARVLLPALALAACHAADRLQYDWDDRRVLCSIAVDDLTQKEPAKTVVDNLMLARDAGSVALFHAHNPNVTITTDMLDQILSAADAAGLEYITWDHFDDGPHTGGIALAFDDNFPDAWIGIRDLLNKHRAKVTFFLTRWAKMTDAQHDEMQELAADGHAIEAHSVNHLHARDYVAEHGLDAYMADEALPSIQVLEDAGFHITGYAFPFGESSDELNAALLEHVERVRVSPGSCPY
jgi:polysaccharide deacetylase